MSTSTFFGGGSKHSDFVGKLSLYEDGIIASATSETVLGLLLKCNDAISDKSCTKNELAAIFDFLEKCNKNSSNIAIKIETIELEKKCLTKLQHAPVSTDDANRDIAMIPRFDHFTSRLKQQIAALDIQMAAALQEAFKITKENWVNRKTENELKLKNKEILPTLGKLWKTITSSMTEQDVAIRIEVFDNFAKTISNRTDGLKMATDVITLLDNLSHGGMHGTQGFSAHVDPEWTFLSMLRENLLKELGVHASDLGSKKEEMILLFGHAIHADQTKSYSNDQSTNILTALDFYCRLLEPVAALERKNSQEFNNKV